MDHDGRVIYFAGEDKAALVGTAPLKGRKPLCPKPRYPEESPEAFSSDDEVHAPVAQYLPIGSPSPSGNPRKRARVAHPTHPTGSPSQRVAGRAVKPVPFRHGPDDEPRKRKQSGAAAAMQPSEGWPTAEAPLGGFPVATPMYQPSVPPAPFSMQPLYVGHNAFSGPTYQPPYFGQHPYGQQAWPPMNPNNATQQWPPVNPYSQQEDMDPYMGMRRGAYGAGGQY